MRSIMCVGQYKNGMKVADVAFLHETVPKMSEKAFINFIKHCQHLNLNNSS